MKGSYVTKILSGVFMMMLVVGLVSCGGGDDDENSPSSSDNATPTVYAILAIDDTDYSIGTSDMIDQNNLNQWLAALRENTGFPLETTTLTSSAGNLTRAALASTIASVRAKMTGNDVVIFWYSGHGGANEETGGSRWPLLAFMNNELPDFNADVIVPLKAIGAKLVIAAADCCNNFSSQAKRSPLQFVKGAAENYATLFRKQGTIVMSGAAPGEFSIGDDMNGGAFTNQFLQAFYENVASDAPDWATITTNAIRPIALEGNVQSPQLEIQIN